MTSIINKTDGSVLATIADGTVDSSTSLVLIGKNYAGYGDFLNENFVHLLENAASETPPAKPIAGQLWWDKTNKTLKVCTDNTTAGFKTISSSISQETPPDNAVIGDMWWDTFNGKLNIFNGLTWTMIGPGVSAGSGTTGTIVDSIIDTDGNSHLALKIFIEETVVAIVSKDSSYTPDQSVQVLDGFETIEMGFNLGRALSGVAYHGTATNATALNEVSADNYARLDVPAVHTSTIKVNNDSGLTIGQANNFTQAIASNAVVLTNTTGNPTGDVFTVRAKIGTDERTLLSISGASGAISQPQAAQPTDTSADTTLATVGYVKTRTGENLFLRDGSVPLLGPVKTDPSSSSYAGPIDFGNASTRMGTFFGIGFVGNTVQAATIGNIGTAITGASVSAATIGNVGANFSGNVASLTTLNLAGSMSALSVAVTNKLSATTVDANVYLRNGVEFKPGVSTLNNLEGTVNIVGAKGITTYTSNGNVVVEPLSTHNGFGTRTITTTAPTASTPGIAGDIWYQI